MSGVPIAYLIVMIIFLLPIYKILRAKHLLKKDKIFLILLIILLIIISTIIMIVEAIPFVLATNEEKIEMLRSGTTSISIIGYPLILLSPLIIFIYAKFFYKKKKVYT